jgi:uncharacterized protein YxeA
MKKIFVILLTLVFIAIVISSCKIREKCPAYGETQKYQIEQKY